MGFGLLHASPTMAELLTLRHSLAIAKANNFHHFSFETDSSATLQLLANDHPSYHNLITECRSLIEETQETVPTKIFREQNVVTNVLVKEGARS